MVYLKGEKISKCVQSCRVQYYVSNRAVSNRSVSKRDTPGDGNLLATANVLNKSTSSSESNLPKRKRTADQTGSNLHSVTESASGSKAKKSSNITSLNDALLANRTSRQGIIRNIPLEFTEEEIKKEIVCPYDIVNVRRLNRRSSTLSDSGLGSVNYIPSKTVCIAFKGQVLPKYIFFCMVRYDVTPFISKISICSSCLRYGHTSTQCKGHLRCSHCAERSHEEGSSCPKINSPPSH
ncbi:uncharacterized protein LOC115245303 [Formica exsecta]|uniref:uncharacterized protein LOC115245303 n=1 Tax=Formica exsecta TaxID=72781 RepID=UPI00114480EF|nr:uncharacterized protein LOC115245303 [Formica exsecta]